ncbi:MAG: hypothetical protein AAB867_00115, partial [Patescibacteria group bacterium]
TEYGLLGRRTDGENWLHLEELQGLLEEMQDVSARRAVFKDFRDKLGSWLWEKPFMADLAMGLTCATWVQDMWPWRPTVMLTGPTSSGKSSLLKMIQTSYLGLAKEYGDATAAGVVQTLENGKQPILIDEIDQKPVKTQQELLSLARLAGVGQTRSRGTSQQEGKSVEFKHLVWLSGISSSGNAQADLNRQINLELRKINNERFYELDVPEIYALGARVLAATLVSAKDALAIFGRLRVPPNGAGGEYARLWEAHLVPIAMSAAIQHLDTTETITLLHTILNSAMTGDSLDQLAAAADERALLDDLHLQPIELREIGFTERMTLAEAEQLWMGNKLTEGTIKAFGHVGIHMKEVEGEKNVVFDAAFLVQPSGLLAKYPKWVGHGGVLTILKRLTALNPTVKKFKVNRQSRRCIAFNLVKLLDYMGLETTAV